MKKVKNDNLQVQFEPLKVSCNTSDCGNNLHCFRASKSMDSELFPSGTCTQCGISLIDWERVHLHSKSDIQYTFDALKNEWIRHYFWHFGIPQRAINYALRKGRPKLLEAIIKRIEISIGTSIPFHDGWQTPFVSNNPIFYAQHATATCCRKCLNYWYGIPFNRKLLPEEVKYFAGLISKYLDEKIPGLTDSEQKIPPIRNTNE